ncbi:alpha/beta hydrolase-fold protein [Catenulispora pinisilvae]|uniref:alpha/beta hydrolase-fold protein n=1 Tax=Catenulispora pinisilvae TaxID=2705253 RepID=UPI00189159CB|nr:alpha/beta hydrolase-fold protein [Catenulispora pinisilvae]
MLLTLVLALVGATAAAARPRHELKFDVSFPAATRATPADGRAFVIVSTNADSDPREQINIINGAPYWGKDVNGLKPGRSVTLDSGASTYGYPLSTLNQLPPGRYYVQAFFTVYDTFHRGDGSTVQMHMPCGDGQDIFNSPRNMYSTPQWITITGDQDRPVKLALDHVITPADPIPAGGTCQQGNPADSQHVKHIKILSPALTKFWGTPIYIGANVLLPQGYDDPKNANVHYPVEYHFAHFTEAAPHGFKEDGSNSFSQFWLNPSSPKFISVEVREENPFYDSSYVVDSPNVGPYGTATTKELIPALDAQFRTIAAPWARVTAGGSTGGWEALASLVFNPDVFGGTFAGYPDPVDFHRHQIVDIYDDANAYNTLRQFDYPTQRPDDRNTAGDTIYDMAQENLWELALGDHDRSGGAWAIWEAVYGPQGKDGYPALVWDKRTGAIDHTVAAQWKPKDLDAKLAAQWSTLGPQLQGEIHMYVGDTDTYFLNDAVELLQQNLDSQTSPPADATFTYGREKQHGWSPYTDAQWFGVYAAYIASKAPTGTDTSGWRGSPTTAAATAAPTVTIPAVTTTASKTAATNEVRAMLPASMDGGVIDPSATTRGLPR